jgi:predicted DNA-binding transcriptional regulator AlpA
MSTDPRSHFGILSAEILQASELLPLIGTMTLDEQIIVVGKLRAVEVILLEHIMHRDQWHPHHKILAAAMDHLEHEDELLDAKEASRRMGYSTRWLYKNADSLPFTVRQKTGRLRFSKRGLDNYLKERRKQSA